jgi:hypothetical protein
MKAYWGSGGIAPLMLWSRHQGKSPRRLGGPQSRSGDGGEEKNSQPLPEIELQNLDRPARSLVVIPTKLSRLFNQNRKELKFWQIYLGYKNESIKTT